MTDLSHFLEILRCGVIVFARRNHCQTIVIVTSLVSLQYVSILKHVNVFDLTTFQNTSFFGIIIVAFYCDFVVFPICLVLLQD